MPTNSLARTVQTALVRSPLKVMDRQLGNDWLLSLNMQYGKLNLDLCIMQEDEKSSSILVSQLNYFDVTM